MYHGAWTTKNHGHCICTYGPAPVEHVSNVHAIQPVSRYTADSMSFFLLKLVSLDQSPALLEELHFRLSSM
jgi:hypothetical protein